MKIVVCLKSCRRTDVPLRLGPEGRPRNDDAAASQPTPHELAPLLAAVALKGQMPGREVRITAISVGPHAWEPLLRQALASGADEVMRVWGKDWGPAAAGSTSADTRVASIAAAEAITRIQPELVLAGERSRDTGHECFGALLAQRLGMPFAHRTVELVPQDGGWQVRVKLDRGYTQDLALSRPAVVTLAGQPPELPHASLPQWLQAQSAQIPLAPASPIAARIHRADLRPPLPRVKRYTLPEEGLDAEGRIRAIVSLPATDAGTILPQDLGAEEQARRMADFLKERGYL